MTGFVCNSKRDAIYFCIRDCFSFVACAWLVVKLVRVILACRDCLMGVEL